jgi:hypothetical protein
MNASKDSWRIRLLSLYLGDKSLLNILLAIIGFFTSFGFLKGTPNNNYALMLEISPDYIWSALF